MRQRKIFISLILAIALVIGTSCLSWAITRNVNDRQAMVIILAVHSMDQGHIVEFDQCVDLFASETISINLGIYIIILAAQQHCLQTLHPDSMEYVKPQVLMSFPCSKTWQACEVIAIWVGYVVINANGTKIFTN
jgi:hypothetical protein